MLLRPLINVGSAVVAAGILVVVLARYLPKTSLYRRIALVASLPPGEAPALLDPIRVVRTGLTGTAKTTLRPSGKAAFGEHIIDVVTAGDFIEQGSAVRVVHVEGMRVVVEAA